MKLVWPPKKSIKYIIGIDEVGRGPLAGPVTLGFFILKKENLSFLKKILRKKVLKDSKALNEQKRENWFIYLNKLKKENKVDFLTVSFSAKKIDKIGISKCIKEAIKKGLKKINLNENETFIFLDGSLRAPQEFLFQKTIIKGDTKEPVIALASVVAKVTRDKYMKNLHNKFHQYGFNKHKGYGTKKHIKEIKKQGLSSEHRKSFCARIKL